MPCAFRPAPHGRLQNASTSDRLSKMRLRRAQTPGSVGANCREPSEKERRNPMRRLLSTLVAAETFPFVAFLVLTSRPQCSPPATSIPPSYGISKTVPRALKPWSEQDVTARALRCRCSGLLRERTAMRLERLRRTGWAGKSANGLKISRLTGGRHAEVFEVR